VKQDTALQVARHPQVEIDGGGSGGALQPEAPLCVGQVPGQGQHRRVERHLPHLVTDEQPVLDQAQGHRRAVAQHRLGGFPHFLQSGEGPAPQGGQGAGQAGGLDDRSR